MFYIFDSDYGIPLDVTHWASQYGNTTAFTILMGSFE